MYGVRVCCSTTSLFLILTVTGLLLISQLLLVMPLTFLYSFSPVQKHSDAPSVRTAPTPSAVNGSCPEPSPNVGGRIKVYVSDPPSFEELERRFCALGAGGHFKPLSCVPVHSVAIVVPYRDREPHLRSFLQNMHPFLMSQNLEYGIFVVEAIKNETFNRGKLMNIGFVEAQKFRNWSCMIFHDVDLIPEDTRNAYTCHGSPRHFSVAVSTLRYKLPYETFLGGVAGFNVEQFKTINGFSNSFWGWGGEDDEIHNRTVGNHFNVSRYSADVARYTMLRHEEETTNPVNPCRYKLIRSSSVRWRSDGLGDLQYRLLWIERRQLYTRVVVDLLEAQSRASLEKLCQS